jgi:hypothetical protein
MKLAEFNQGPRHTGWYWVQRRPNGQPTPTFAVAVYAHGRTPHNWQTAGHVGWQTAEALHIEEVFEYLGTAPAAAKDAGIASTPLPAIPSAETSPPPLRNAFRELPSLESQRRVNPPRPVIGSNDEPPQRPSQLPLPPPLPRDQSRGTD